MNKLITFFVLAVFLVAAYVLFFKPDGASNKEIRTDDKQVARNNQNNNQPEQTNAMKNSKIQWSAKKIVGSTNHIGTVDLKSGKFETDSDDITGGEFVIDMTSIKNEDLTNQAMNDKLVAHLKSDDFFSVKKNPEASFVSTSIEKTSNENYQVTGDLTIKGITNLISFPATIVKKDDSLIADAEFSINRTEWDIRFGSNTFFGNLGDNAIDDMINFNIHLES